MLSNLKLLHNYKNFSLFYHAAFVIFLLWDRYIKREDDKVPDKYLKILGVITCIMGLIFFFYGDILINN